MQSAEHAIRLYGPAAVRHARVVDLARRLGRNYKNVYDDVKLLKRAGLIEEDEHGAFVKFDRIRADIGLAA